MDTQQALNYHNGADLVRALTDEARQRFLADAVTATIQRSAADLLPRLGEALAEASDLVAPADDARDAAKAEFDRLDALVHAFDRELSAPMVERDNTPGRDKATVQQERADAAELRNRAGKALAAAEAEAQAARDAARSIAAKVDVIAKVAEPDAAEKVAP